MENKRTDLAMEVRESIPEDNKEIKGVVLEEKYEEEGAVKVTTLVIKDRHGEKVMGKPKGTYITIEAPQIGTEQGDFYKPLVHAVCRYLKKLSGDCHEKTVLVAGLGNRDATPDSLGARVTEQLFITRHLIREYGEKWSGYSLKSLCAVTPGVMAQTGMETYEIINGIVAQTKPGLLIVVDALAARSTARLTTTVQITDTGIRPGSGVGNHRRALDQESLGIPVIALGVPTVVDAATIVEDRMEEVLQKQGFSEGEIQAFIRNINESKVENLFVTPKNIDESIQMMGNTIAESLNRCFA